MSHAILGVIGHPISHSLSPRMHRAALAAAGVRASYFAIDVASRDLEATLDDLWAAGVLGFNVTVPHKSAVLSLLGASIEPVAQAIGAVNTVLRGERGWVGTNTDAEGLVRAALKGGARFEEQNVVVIGAGGAARAAVFGAAEAGARNVHVVARNLARAQEMTRGLERCGSTHIVLTSLEDRSRVQRAFETSSLLIQATSATMKDAEGVALVAQLPLEVLPKGAHVMDLVYSPRRTALTTAAEEQCLPVIDGLGMLVHQGALAFERWFGIPAPMGAMSEALEAISG